MEVSTAFEMSLLYSLKALCKKKKTKKRKSSTLLLLPLSLVLLREQTLSLCFSLSLTPSFKYPSLSHLTTV
jgi:hypothetical protein